MIWAFSWRDEQRGPVDDGLLDTLLRIEDRVISVYGLSLHVSVQGRTIEGTGTQYLLDRCAGDDDMQRRNSCGVGGPGRQEPDGARHQLIVVGLPVLLA